LDGAKTPEVVTENIIEETNEREEIKNNVETEIDPTQLLNLFAGNQKKKLQKYLSFLIN